MAMAWLALLSCWMEWINLHLTISSVHEAMHPHIFSNRVSLQPDQGGKHNTLCAETAAVLDTARQMLHLL
jgi:hypothetical protein